MIFRTVFIFLTSLFLIAPPLAGQGALQNASSYSTTKSLHYRTFYDDVEIVVPNKATYDFFFDFTNVCNDDIIRTMQQRLGACMTCCDATLFFKTDSCRYVDKTYTGVKIEGTCTDTVLRGTEFNNHVRGLWVFGGSGISNAVLDNQTHKGNKWILGFDATNKAAYLGTNTVEAQNLQPPRFIYNADNPNASVLFSSYTTQIAAQWFQSVNLGVNDPTTFICTTCATALTSLAASNTTADFSPEEIAIAENAVDFGSYENVANWEAQKDLYEKVSIYNGVIVSGSAIDVFRDSVQTTEIKDFTDVSKEVKAAFDVPAALKAQMQSYQNIADAYGATFVYLDSLYESTTDTLMQANYLTQMQAIKIQITATHTQLEQINALISTERDLKIDNTTDLNALLAEGEVYQYNKKRVTDIALNTVAKGHTNLSASEWAEIALIAHQCPYSGGKAVYEARSIYAAISGEIYDDHAICAAVGIQARIIRPSPKASASPAKGVEKGDVYLYPNPTSGVVQLFVPAVYQSAVLMLTNTVGQQLQTSIINGTVNAIDISDLPEGVYFITVQQDGKAVYQNKIVKIH